MTTVKSRGLLIPKRLSRYTSFTGVSMLFACSLIIALTPPASRYEMSMYAAYPAYFWFFAIAGILCGLLTVLMRGFGARVGKLDWTASVTSLISLNVLIMILPVMRGYFINNLADGLSHLGLIRDIQITGYIGASNMYPAAHILSLTVAVTSDSHTAVVMNWIPSVYYIVYVSFLFIVVRTIAGKSTHSYMALAIGSVLMFIYFTNILLPTQLFLYAVPMTLFLLYKSCHDAHARASGFDLAQMAVILSLCFLHPLGSLFLVAIILMYDVANKRTSGHFPPSSPACARKSRRAVLQAAFTAIVFVSWFSGSRNFEKVLQQARDWLLYGYGDAPVDIISSAISLADFSALNVILLMMMNYGHMILLASISCVLMYIALRKRNSFSPCIRLGVYFSAIFFVSFLAFFITTILSAFIFKGVTLRVFCWVLLASAMLNSILLGESYKWRWFKPSSAHAVVISGMILGIAVIGVLTVYQSPIVFRADLHATEADWEGLVWFTTSKGSNPTFQLDDAPRRIPGAMYGYDGSAEYVIGNYTLPPERLGYDVSDEFGNALQDDSFLVVSQRTWEYKTYIWPSNGRYFLEDLERLDNDPSVSLLYSNGGLDVYFIVSN